MADLTIGRDLPAATERRSSGCRRKPAHCEVSHLAEPYLNTQTVFQAGSWGWQLELSNMEAEQANESSKAYTLCDTPW